MTTLPLKMFLWKRGTASSILALALLVAILASTASIVNDINSQTETLAKTRDIGQPFLVMSKNSTSTTNSKISLELTNLLNNSNFVKNLFPQKIVIATLITKSKNHTALLRGVDPKAYLDFRHAYLNGSLAEDMQANIGEILARLASIDRGDEVTLVANNKSVKVEVAGIVKAFAQTDTEIIVPMNVANLLDEDNNKVSIIEFTTKGNQDEISKIRHLLPTDVKIVEVQQTKAFIQNINSQTISFLSMWSLVIYATIMAASYIVATRLLIESSYELRMLKALGAKRTLLFTTILIFSLTIALFGSILGLSIGLAGAQAVSTITRWMWRSIQVTPHLEIEQTIQIILFTLTFSIIGCIYPAIKVMYKNYEEITL